MRGAIRSLGLDAGYLGERCPLIGSAMCPGDCVRILHEAIVNGSPKERLDLLSGWETRSGLSCDAAGDERRSLRLGLGVEAHVKVHAGLHVLARTRAHGDSVVKLVL